MAAVDRVCRVSRLAWLDPGSSSPFAQPREVKQDQSLQPLDEQVAPQVETEVRRCWSDRLDL